ncbi:hypothetical protein [Commensalibacter papalotli (ex Servin-Garciduenas et al. 2014)]|uniref:Uncharacterized protein n=1 Tax=Commensalibacter papalotli (ex Servin-Garciduenas et al. 2014) TaxID=1208583 RepID=W7E1G4_9PROT|nr:hypothetical protein [Commensalibacter papalotli (ex Servin-Garciduenas et al. 2014)]EUK18919.1 hypothetical protein COMX_04195 [Commensalibacter papalotli (ex Servin-Garciduenas et al. 2014)]
MPSFKRNRSIQTIALLFLFVIIMCLRAPDVFLYGRFWAEEGYIFFYNAWTMSPLQALFHPFAGYLNLSTNGVTLIARWCIPFEYAPYLTTIIGILFQLLPLFLLLTAKDEWLVSFQVRLFLTLLLLFVPETAETSLHSLHIQFQLTLACGVILILQPSYSYQRWLKIIILLLAGLSGLMVFALLPIYAIRCWIDKNKLRIEQFSILLLSCLIQYFFFYEKVDGRLHAFFVSDFLNIFFIHELYIPFLGNNSYTVPYMAFLHDHMHDLYAFVFPCVIVALFITGIIYIFYKNATTRPAIFLFLAALTLFSISIIGSIGDRNSFLIPFANQRYVFISQSLLCIMLVYITYHLPNVRRKIGKIIICWLIFVGGIHFFTQPAFIVKAPKNYLSWQQQVALWKKDPDYTFQIWPSNWVQIKLPVKK